MKNRPPHVWRRFRLGAAVAVVAGFGAFVLDPSSFLSAQAPRPSAPGPAAAEIALAKRVIAARREYQTSLEQIRAQYVAAADAERTKAAEDELRQFHRVPKHAYVLDLDVPGPGLRAEQNVPAANDLYRRAMEYKDKGYGTDFQDNQIRAELLLQQLINQYPTSNKISDAAFQLGDIYESRTYRQLRRAAAFYERCFQWNPNTQFDARLRAARLYDKSLNDRQRAVELYRTVGAYETDPRRMQEAQRRLAELNAGP